MFSSRLLFSCSIHFPSDEWENFELNENCIIRQEGKKKPLRFFLFSFATRAAHLSKNARRLVRLTNFSNVGVSY